MQERRSFSHSPFSVRSSSCNDAPVIDSEGTAVYIASILQCSWSKQTTATIIMQHCSILISFQQVCCHLLHCQLLLLSLLLLLLLLQHRTPTLNQRKKIGTQNQLGVEVQYIFSNDIFQWKVFRGKSFLIEIQIVKVSIFRASGREETSFIYIKHWRTWRTWWSRWSWRSPGRILCQVFV